MHILNVGSGGRPHPEWMNLDYMNPLLWKIRARRASFPQNYVNVKLPKHLPFEDGRFDGIYCAQVVEHFTRADARRLLEEFCRVVKVGGVVRIVVPDLEYQCRVYLDALSAKRQLDQHSHRAEEGVEEEVEEQYEFAKLWLLDQFVRQRPGGDWAHFVRAAKSDDLRTTFRFPTAGPARKSLPLRLPSSLNYLRTIRRGELHRWAYDSEDLVGAALAAGFTGADLVRFDQSKVQSFSEFDRDSEGEIQPGSLYVEAWR